MIVSTERLAGPGASQSAAIGAPTAAVIEASEA